MGDASAHPYNNNYHFNLDLHGNFLLIKIIKFGRTEIKKYFVYIYNKIRFIEFDPLIFFCGTKFCAVENQ